MPRPGTNLVLRETPPTRQAATDTGVWFVEGLTEKGPVNEALLITSLTEYERYYGARVSYGHLYDALDVFFREGGSRAYVGRLVGPAALAASVILQNSTPANTLKVAAKSPGEWGNALNVQVLAGGVGGTFVLLITHDTLGELERSPDLLDEAAAIEWASNSDYIVVTDEVAAGDPAVGGPFNLAGGVDDRASILDSHWTAGLGLFVKDLGPGQVSMPGRTSSTNHTALQNHAQANSRVALLDSVNSNVKATLLAQAQALQLANGKWSAIFGPWLTCPGVIPGTDRTVAPSALVAGAIARTDAAGGSPNTPAAGENGQALFCNGLAAGPLTDADREDLNEEGHNAIIMKYGGVRIYGWRSLADPVSESGWINFANVRLVMEIASVADAIGEGYLFDEVDGQARKIGEYGGALTGMLTPYWSIGSLYGLTPDEAFLVDVGPGVNTPTTIANLELRAIIMLKPSPFAEEITLELVKARVTDVIPT